MEEALIAKLLSTSGLTALVSTRVYPGSRPQASALPSVIVNRVSGGPGYADDGEIGIEESRLQIDCWGTTFSSAKLVSRQVRAALSAFFETEGAIRFRYIELDLEHDIREAGSNSSEYLFRTSLDFIVVYDN